MNEYWVIAENSLGIKQLICICNDLVEAHEFASTLKRSKKFWKFVVQSKNRKDN